MKITLELQLDTLEQIAAFGRLSTSKDFQALSGEPVKTITQGVTTSVTEATKEVPVETAKTKKTYEQIMAEINSKESHAPEQTETTTQEETKEKVLEEKPKKRKRRTRAEMAAARAEEEAKKQAELDAKESESLEETVEENSLKESSVETNQEESKEPVQEPVQETIQEESKEDAEEIATSKPTENNPFIQIIPVGSYTPTKSEKYYIKHDGSYFMSEMRSEGVLIAANWTNSKTDDSVTTFDTQEEAENYLKERLEDPQYKFAFVVDSFDTIVSGPFSRLAPETEEKPGAEDSELNPFAEFDTKEEAENYLKERQEDSVTQVTNEESSVNQLEVKTGKEPVAEEPAVDPIDKLKDTVAELEKGVAEKEPVEQETDFNPFAELEETSEKSTDSQSPFATTNAVNNDEVNDFFAKAAAALNSFDAI
ncbi:hypothetical protein [Pseudolactococcus insecticola]|uniref:Uncharacterized protein n=1 Tax=Pseudolactococcus insecticola TaxID=2709158 RepID=A0A6A0B9W8_9LACT|nr:hypothetical protein [Lactococcus insecticola]GFH41413.1 hypothetical protein Hs20B_18110 [Lactococcus insecticola]